MAHPDPLRWLECAPLFESLPAHELCGLAARAHRCRFERGEAVMTQGQAPPAVYLVLEGCIAVGTVTASGREAILALRGAGELVGEHALAEDLAPPDQLWGYANPFLPAGWARAASELLAIPLDAAGRLPERYPSFARAFAALMLERWAAAAEGFADVVTGEIHERVRFVLERLGVSAGIRCADGVLIDLPVTQGDLAAMVGASRESVNRVLRRMVAAGDLATPVMPGGSLVLLRSGSGPAEGSPPPP